MFQPVSSKRLAFIGLVSVLAACVNANGKNGHADRPSDEYLPPTFTAREMPFEEVIKGDRSDPNSGGQWGICLHLDLIEESGREERCRVGILIPKVLWRGATISKDRAQQWAVEAMNETIREQLPKKRRIGEQYCRRIRSSVAVAINSAATQLDYSLGRGMSVIECSDFRGQLPAQFFRPRIRVGPWASDER